MATIAPRRNRARISPKRAVIALGAAISLGLALPALSAEDLHDSALTVENTVPFPSTKQQRLDHDRWGIFGFDALWVNRNPQLVRVNPADLSQTVIDVPGILGPVRRATAGEGAIWLADTGSNTLFKIDPISNRVVGSYPAEMISRDSMIGVGAGSAWLVTAEHAEATLTRFDAKSGVVQAVIALPAASNGGALFAGDAIWVMGTRGNAVYRVDPTTNKIVATIPVNGSPSFATTDGKSIWVNNRTQGIVDRIDIVSNTLVASITTGFMGSDGPDDISYADGYVWLAMPGITLVQIDPTTNSIKRIYRREKLMTIPSVAFGAGALWLLSFSDIYRIAPPQ